MGKSIIKLFEVNYYVNILPMANFDEGARGKSRFGMSGMDLNRNPVKLADPVLSPGNYYMEQWFERMINKDMKPACLSVGESGPEQIKDTQGND